MNRRISNLILTFLLFLTPIFTSFARVPLGAIKDIEKNVKAEYLRITPIVGLGWWHSDYIRNIAEYGDETEGMANLARALFHEVQGQFTVTQNDSYPARHFTPQLIGKIIQEVEKSIASKGSVSQLKDTLRKLILAEIGDAIKKVRGEYDRLQKEIKIQEQEKKNLDTFLSKNRNELQILLGSIKNDLTKKNIKFPPIKKLAVSKQVELFKECLAGAYAKQIAEIVETKKQKVKERFEKLRKNYKESMDKMGISLDFQENPYEQIKAKIAAIKKKQADNNPEKIVKNNMNALLDGIAGAYQESGYFDNEPNLFKYGLNSLLMAFLYEKFDSKKDYQDYLTVFDDKYFTQGGKAAISAAGWTKPEYTEPLYEKNLSFEQYIYSEVFRSCFNFSFPNSVNYKVVVYKKDSKVFAFPDCAETAARNIANCVLYNSRSNVIDLKIDEKKKLNWNLNKDLINFYKKHRDVSRAGVTAVYEDWAHVVENREWVAYNRVSVDANARAINIDDSDGFIPIPHLEAKIKVLQNKKDLPKDVEVSKRKIGGHEFTRLKVGERTYFLFDSKSGVISYELMPSLRNFIVLFNQLFGLKDLGKLTLKEILLKQDFNSGYAKKMFTKLGFSNVNMPQFGLDKNDFVDGKKVEIEIKEDGSTLDIILYRGHGQADAKTKQDDYYLEREGINKKTKLDLKMLQTIIIHSPFYDEIIEREVYKIGDGKTKFKRWLYVMTTRDKVFTASDLMGGRAFKNINPEQKKIVSRFWIKFVKKIPFIDGETQKNIVNKFVFYGWVAYKIIFGGEFKDLVKNSLGNESFLYLVLYYIQKREGWNRRVPWNAIVAAALEEAGKSNNENIKQITTAVYKIFFNEVTSDKIAVSKFKQWLSRTMDQFNLENTDLNMTPENFRDLMTDSIKKNLMPRKYEKYIVSKIDEEIINIGPNLYSIDSETLSLIAAAIEAGWITEETKPNVDTVLVVCREALTAHSENRNKASIEILDTLLEKEKQPTDEKKKIIFEAMINGAKDNRSMYGSPKYLELLEKIIKNKLLADLQIKDVIKEAERYINQYKNEEGKEYILEFIKFAKEKGLWPTSK